MWSQNLVKHQWNERVVLIVADKNNIEIAEQQFDILIKDKEKLIDRNIVLYKCLDEKCTFYNWKYKPETFLVNTPSKGFKMIVIGLDGGEKYSSNSIEKSDVVFSLIDTMPMRRQELKARKKND